MYFDLDDFKEGRERELFRKLTKDNSGIEVFAYALSFNKENMLIFNKKGARFVKPFHGQIFETMGFNESEFRSYVCFPVIRELKNGKLLKKEINVFSGNSGVYLKVFESEEEMLSSYKEDLILYEKARDKYVMSLDNFIVDLKQSLRES